MANYTKDMIKDKIERFGEVFVVLDSDREYEVHGSESIEFKDSGSNLPSKRKFTEIRFEGMRDGEFVIAEVPLDSVEHVYTHREV